MTFEWNHIFKSFLEITDFVDWSGKRPPKGKKVS